MKAKLWSLSRSPKRSMGHLRGMMAFVLPCRFLPTHSVGRGQIGANGSYGASSWPHSLCLLTTWLLVPGFSSIVQPLWISLCDPDAAISIPQIPFRSAFPPPLLPQPRCLFCFGFDALLPTIPGLTTPTPPPHPTLTWETCVPGPAPLETPPDPASLRPSVWPHRAASLCLRIVPLLRMFIIHLQPLGTQWQSEPNGEYHRNF